MNVIHMVTPIYLVINWYWSIIDLYSIKLIFYNVIVLDGIFNMNNLDHQNKSKMGSKIFWTVKIGLREAPGPWIIWRVEGEEIEEKVIQKKKHLMIKTDGHGLDFFFKSTCILVGKEV